MSKPLVARRPTDLEPQVLDRPIERAAAALSQALDAWEALHPLVSEVLREMGVEVSKTAGGEVYLSDQGKPVTRESWLRSVSRDLVGYVDKLSKGLTQMTKAVDEAARLREFLTGGPDSRPDLSNASDGELIETLIEVVIARNLIHAVIKRAQSRGIEVTVG